MRELKKKVEHKWRSKKRFKKVGKDAIMKSETNVWRK